MESGKEKAHITFDPTEIARGELVKAILQLFEESGDGTPKLLDEQGEENELILLIPEGTLSAIVDIRGVVRGRSEEVL